MSASRDRGAILQASLPLGRVAGVPIALHYSWFLIATLITASLGFHFSSTQPEWPAAFVWGIAAFTAVLFFVTLVVHELSHALVARAHGLPVRSITLFALGGVAQIDKESNTARGEFLIAIVGPVTSATIGAVCLAAARALGWTAGGAGTGATAAILGWLGSINLLLAAFNLIPGYPLDGGRVLRAVLWGLSGDASRATRNAARTGQVVAAAFMIAGLLGVIAGAGLGGLWIAIIGWFLLSAAQASYAQATLTETLRGVRVGDVMIHDCATVDVGTSLQALVDEVLLRTGRRCVLVGSHGHVLGLVTPHEVRTVDRTRWPATPVRDVMRPLDHVKTVTPETPATEAFTEMAREDLSQLPVMRDGHVEGVVSRGQILQLLEARSELGR